MTPLSAAEVERRLNYFISDRFEPCEQKVSTQDDNISELSNEVSKLCGQVEVITRLMWGVILGLVGLLIQGAIG